MFLENYIIVFNHLNQGPNLDRSANPFTRFVSVFRYVIDKGNTKLSRAGQKIFGLLNLQLSVWPSTFLAMYGQNISFDRRVAQTPF